MTNYGLMQLGHLVTILILISIAFTYIFTVAYLSSVGKLRSTCFFALTNNI